MRESLYDVLGVDDDASAEQLRSAFRSRAQLLHPDRNGDPRAGDAMRRLNEAWHVLGDPQRRAAYDRGLALRGRRWSPEPDMDDPSDPDDTGGGSSADGRSSSASVGGRVGESDRLWLAPHRMRVPLTVLVLVVLLAIVVLTAYAGPHATR